jgi:type III secretion protein W
MSSIGGNSPHFNPAAAAHIAAKKADMKEEAQAETTSDRLEENGPQSNLAAKAAVAKKESLASRRASSTNKKGDAKKAGKTEKTDETQESGSKSPAGRVKEKVKEFEDENPDISGESGNALENLLDSVKPGDSKEEILGKVKGFFPDTYLQSEALNFLSETTEGDLHDTVTETKGEFEQHFDREIKAGKNISKLAQSFAKDGLGSPTELRQMYRDLTGSPKEPKLLFTELTSKYKYKDMNKIIKFMMHSLGNDFRSGGPSMPKGQIHNTFQVVRSLQMILGVYRFFKTREGLVASMYKEIALPVPPQLNFESLSKAFMSIAADRYPTADRVLRQTQTLGAKGIEEKIITITQFRDAVPEVATEQIFRSVNHKHEVTGAIIGALEGLEDQLEALQEEADSILSDNDVLKIMGEESRNISNDTDSRQ